MSSETKDDSQFVAVNGVRLCVKQAGANIGKSRTMVFVHGLGFSKENMDPLFNYYKDLHHVVSYDVRGAGHITFFENFPYTVQRIDEFPQNS